MGRIPAFGANNEEPHSEHFTPNRTTRLETTVNRVALVDSDSFFILFSVFRNHVSRVNVRLVLFTQVKT